MLSPKHGAIMAANQLNSERAVEASVEVARAFVRLRQMVVSDGELARRLADLEQQYDHQFKVVFSAIRQLMAAPAPKEKQIGLPPQISEEVIPVSSERPHALQTHPILGENRRRRSTSLQLV